jgi:hypothetical protein
MANLYSLQDDANAIESAICKFDEEQNNGLNDGTIVNIIQLLLDRFHFQDPNLVFSNRVEEDGFKSISRDIEEDFPNKSTDEIAKLLGTIYRSALRHKAYGRAYIDFIHGHVGLRVGKGARMVKNLY